MLPFNKYSLRARDLRQRMELATKSMAKTKWWVAETFRGFLLQVNVQETRAKMVDRVLEKTFVVVHPITLVLSARGRDWGLKRTRHQTPRQF